MSKNSALKREAQKYANCDMQPTEIIEFKRNKLEPLNESQRIFISSLLHDSIVIGSGAAGTGKTYIASRIAGRLYKSSKNINNIILTRPNVEAGEKMGHLPGELHEKYEPYMHPFEKGLMDELGAKFKNDLNKKILPQPLGYMRGKTFDDSIIMLDEAQNTTVEQMKMFVSRMGMGSRLFITGDTKQTDLNPNKENGLAWLIRQIKGQNKPIEIVEFSRHDCVRSDECKMFLEMIENEI